MAASLVFRLQDRGPQLVREVLLERGWKEYDGRKREEEDWNLYWRASAFPEYHSLLPWQRLNHHPKTAGICRKDLLVRNLRRMRATFGSALYDFSPTTFILPNEYTRFLAEYNRLLPARDRTACWICKPVDLSRGRGIFLFRDLKDLVYDCPVIVQRYVSSPLLISGYKFDLRIYVCVKSFHPLTVYIHQEVLVRFATEKYNLSSLSNVYAHLTNTSINKGGPFYKTPKGQVGPGCKWTISKFRHFLQGQGINELFLWQRISNMVTLTLLAIAPSVPSCPNCVQLFGFDVLVDSEFKPWLLEVNHSPSLTLECQTDVVVKKGLISDLVDLMNYTSADRLRDRAYQTQRNVNVNLSVPVPLLPKTKEHNLQRKNKKSWPYQRDSLAAYQRHLPPVGALNWILGSYSKTNMAAAKGGPALSSHQMKYGPRVTEVTNRDNTETVAETELSGENEVAASVPDTRSRRSTFRRSTDSSRFPNIHRGSQRVHVQGPVVLTGQHIPPTRVGGFIRTFPFNPATLKASRDTLDVLVILQELQKLTGQVASGRRDETKEAREDEADEDDRFDSLLWGPEDPLPLSRRFKNAYRHADT
ncbi:probable tubulin polyglutamylase TTLL2 [Fundulus heteroclitus]|uniref:probable tubulin polyglutamylase TTLL2 n=1 Tax=Fundulus heteroclitus TaxID=8078 RepID=UPI00165AB13D|nr:probable tubulin polyglutamylase TTLL2 [Fundulus heteroclitus]